MECLGLELMPARPGGLGRNEGDNAMLFTTLLAQEAQAPVAPPLLLFATIGAAILLAIAFLVWALVKPNVGRMFAHIFAVLAIGLGAGVLTWGIVAASLTGTVRGPFGLASLISEPSEAIGWGAGCLAAGITALVLSFVVGCTKQGDGKKHTTC